MKVLWVSDLVTHTGFSTVSHNILKHLKGKVKPTGLGVNYFGDPHKYDFPIYPAGLGSVRDPMGYNRIAKLINANDFDLIFILNDVWVIDQYLERIKKEVPKEKIPPIVIYFPVDAEDHFPGWYKNFDIVSQAVVYTEFGKRVALKASPDLDLKIIPHGVDTSTFYQKFATRKEAQKSFSSKSFPDFLILNANRNQPRKRLDITLKAFKIFAEGKSKKDVGIYMHCGVKDAHIDVIEMAKRLDIDDKLFLTNLNNGPQQVSVEVLNHIYNLTTVGVNSGMGEGWGLTSIEHAVTGAPQILPDHSACSEIYKDCGLLVPTKCDYTFDGIMTTGKLIDPEDLAKAFQRLYDDSDLFKKLRDAGISKFTSTKYNWKYIANQWLEVFNSVI